jgi:DNA-binding FrmR family transcriptional regulator
MQSFKKSKKELMAKRKQTTLHPNHAEQLSKLNRVEGQVAGIKKMIEDRRYCTEIIQQVRATRKALATVEASLLETHLINCVTASIEGGNKKEKEKKILEVIQIFKSAVSQGIDL